jgi:hypothetical protein
LAPLFFLGKNMFFLFTIAVFHAPKVLEMLPTAVFVPPKCFGVLPTVVFTISKPFGGLLPPFCTRRSALVVFYRRFALAKVLWWSSTAVRTRFYLVRAISSGCNLKKYKSRGRTSAQRGSNPYHVIARSEARATRQPHNLVVIPRLTRNPLIEEIAGRARNDNVRLEIGFAELRFATVASLNPLAMTVGGCP